MGNVEKEMIIFVCGPSDYADTKSICGNLRYTLGYIQEKRHKKIKILLKRESGNFCDVVRDYAEANNIEIEEDSSKGDSFAKKIDLCVAFYKPKCGVDKEIQKVLQNEKIIHALFISKSGSTRRICVEKMEEFAPFQRIFDKMY